MKQLLSFGAGSRRLLVELFAQAAAPIFHAALVISLVIGSGQNGKSFPAFLLALFIRLVRRL
jgi:hypothetical protein